MDCVQLHCFRALNYSNFKFFFRFAITGLPFVHEYT